MANEKGFKQYVICTFVNYKTGTSGFKKLVTIKNNDKEMQFIDTRSDDLIWFNEIHEIGVVKELTQQVG